MRASYQNVKMWKRPSELVSSHPKLWGGQNVRPDDVKQGSLGDCWFLASASAIAEYPDRIKKIFVNNDYSYNGIFEMKMFAGGEEKSLVIDDRLPMYSKTYPFNTKKSSDGAFWMPILEKGFAKFSVNYARLNGGDMSWAMDALTNMPQITIKQGSMSNDAFFQLVKKYDLLKSIMTSANYNGKDNLVAAHAYTVLGVQELKDSNGVVQQQLIKMRNPWGTEKYQGDWRDDDSRWNQGTYKDQAGLVNAKDGVFFVPIEKFTSRFPDI